MTDAPCAARRVRVDLGPTCPVRRTRESERARVEDTPAGIAADDAITVEELQLAARNHGMPLEGLRYDVTPLGMHYLLIHFDIPLADERAWTVAVSTASSTAR